MLRSLRALKCIEQIVVRTFLIFWLVYFFNVKRIVKRDLNNFKSVRPQIT